MDASIETPIPDPLEVGAGTALLVRGRCGLREARRPRLELAGNAANVDAWGMPEPGRLGPGEQFWAVLPVAAQTPAGPQELRLTADVGGRVESAVLATVEVVAGAAPEPVPGPRAGERPLIAICMATHEPDPEMLRGQIDSIRAQTRTGWVCMISDDASSAAARVEIERVIEGDERFRLSASAERLGFYENFERALRMAPPEAELIAIADQDDVWNPDKLAVLERRLDRSPSAGLAYSDMRLVDESHELISETSWVLRRNCWTDMGSLLVANTVTGAASLLRRELLDRALPFPPASGEAFHDHWLALCALASGEISYLDQATYDHVRHPDSFTVREGFGVTRPVGDVPLWRLRLKSAFGRLRRRARRPGWRSMYFDRYLLAVQYAVVLRLRFGAGMDARRTRPLRRVESAERTISGPAWLAARSLRPYIGRNETFARERVLLGAVLWRRLAGTTARLRRPRP